MEAHRNTLAEDMLIDGHCAIEVLSKRAEEAWWQNLWMDYVKLRLRWQ